MLVRESITVPANHQKLRIPDFAHTVFTSIPSRKGIKKAIKRGEILIDDQIAQGSEWVQTGQKIELVDLQRSIPKTYRLPLEVVFEDDYLAVINKPAGIEVNGNKFKTVENALPGSLQPSPLPGALPWPRPVHRIDYSTSGLLLIAKTILAQVELGRQFQKRLIHKKYHAVVMGRTPPSGSIETPIHEQSAHSEFKTLKTVPSLRSEEITLMELSPHTGRTHQLRIHMASIGHPIVGDSKYGETGNTLKGKGLFLAAVALDLLHPIHHEPLCIKIDTPYKFQSLLKREAQRWEKYHPPGLIK